VYNRVMSGSGYRDVWCMIQWGVVHDTPDFTYHSLVHVTVMSGAYMIQWCLVYDTVMSGV